MGLPSLWYDRAQVGAGGLISANGNPEEAMREAVAIAALVLKGTKPGEIAVRTPTQFEIAVNLRVARAMKIEVPPSVLLRASVKYEK